jgi:deoxyxylulose-5-phosphate synthase
VINMPTVKPIDVDLINDVARNVGAIVTLENHNVQGGFGSAVAEVLVNNQPVPTEFIGLQNEYSESASEYNEYEGRRCSPCSDYAMPILLTMLTTHRTHHTRRTHCIYPMY